MVYYLISVVHSYTHQPIISSCGSVINSELQTIVMLLVMHALFPHYISCIHKLCMVISLASGASPPSRTVGADIYVQYPTMHFGPETARALHANVTGHASSMQVVFSCSLTVHHYNLVPLLFDTTIPTYFNILYRDSDSTTLAVT